MTLYELCKEFEKNYVRERLRPTTQSGYINNINNHIIPYLAAFDVEKLNADHIDGLTVRLHQDGLSNKTIIYVLWCHNCTKCKVLIRSDTAFIANLCDYVLLRFVGLNEHINVCHIHNAYSSCVHIAVEI